MESAYYIGAFRRAYRSAEGSLPYARTHYYRRDLRQYEEYEEVLGQHRMPKTLAEFQSLKYNQREEFLLFEGFKTANKKKHISPLVSFDVYKQVSNEIDKKLVGKTFDGVIIKGKKTHFIDRIIGEYQESDHKQEGKRQGVLVDDALNALQTPINKSKRLNDDGSTSLTFIGERCKVTINPDTGLLIQTNRRHKKR